MTPPKEGIHLYNQNARQNECSELADAEWIWQGEGGVAGDEGHGNEM